jgi:hypothetical protein
VIVAAFEQAGGRGAVWWRLGGGADWATGLALDCKVSTARNKSKEGSFCMMSLPGGGLSETRPNGQYERGSTG